MVRGVGWGGYRASEAHDLFMDYKMFCPPVLFSLFSGPVWVFFSLLEFTSVNSKISDLSKSPSPL